MFRWTFSTLYGFVLSETCHQCGCGPHQVALSVPSTGSCSVKLIGIARFIADFLTFSTLYGFVLSETSLMKRARLFIVSFSTLYGFVLSETIEVKRNMPETRPFSTLYGFVLSETLEPIRPLLDLVIFQYPLRVRAQ